MRREQITFMDEMPEGCPLLVIRAFGRTRILVGREWEAVIGESGVPGACAILDEALADVDRQDGTPARERRAGIRRPRLYLAS